MEYSENDILELAKDLQGLGIETFDGIEVTGYTYSPSDLERDIRMAKMFILPGLPNRRILKITGERNSKSNGRIDHIMLSLSSHDTLEWRTEIWRSEWTGNKGLSLLLINHKTGERTEIFEKEKMGVGYQNYLYMMEGEGIHHIPPVMAMLVLVGSYMKDNFESFVGKLGYKLIRK